jgi:hypothetical protein
MLPQIVIKSYGSFFRMFNRDVTVIVSFSAAYQ